MTKDLGMIGEEMQVVVQAHKIVEEKKNWKEVMVVMALLNNVWRGNFIVLSTLYCRVFFLCKWQDAI